MCMYVYREVAAEVLSKAAIHGDVMKAARMMMVAVAVWNKDGGWLGRRRKKREKEDEENEGKSEVYA